VFVAVTVTFGATAPVASLTVPVNAPVEADCAKSDGANTARREATINHAQRELLFFGISHPTRLELSTGHGSNVKS
jgi:hypothetical protein